MKFIVSGKAAFRPVPAKLLLVMKLSACLILMATLHVSAAGFSQKVSIKGRDLTITSIFRSIEKQTGYQFIFSKNILQHARPVTVNFNHANLTLVLDKCLSGQSLSYEITNNIIVITSKTTSVDEIPPARQPSNQSFLIMSPPPAEIHGVVTNDRGEPLQGASVAEKNSNSITVTDAGGNFNLKVSNEKTVILISYTGYKTEEISIVNNQTLTIVLHADARGLEDVVVVGYGKQKKTSVTAAISTLKGDKIASTPVTNLSNALAGRVSGVILKQASGEPGRDESNIYIRGISSTGATQPLLIVDGIPRSFQQLDPNTIDNMTILKDAAAVAPYGVAGANGVILVTTKRGKTGAPSLTYNGYVGFQNATVLPDYLDSYQFATLKNAAAKNDGLPAPYSDDALRKYQDGSDPDAYPNWDVFKAVVTPNAILTNHNIELSGGAERIKYYASLGYQYQEGMWSTTNSNRYNMTMNLDADVTKTTRVSFNINGRIQKNLYPAIATSRIFELIGYSFPTTALKYSNGLPGNYTWGSIYNSGYEKINQTAIYSQLAIEQQIPFIPGLTARATVAYDPSLTMDKLWRTPVHIYSIDTTQHPYTFKDGIFEQTQPSLNQSMNQSRQLTYQASLNYIKTSGRHNITALALFESKTNDSLNFGASRRNYNLLIDEINMGNSSQADMTTSGSSAAARQIGLVYRFTYDYDSKYLFEASGRYDGSYFFAPGNRFGFFPAFSVGWRVSEESFIKDNLLWIDNLKLRASYGEVGALAGSAFQYLSTYNISGPSYVFNGSATQGINERSEPNPAITWERAKKTNFGLEASLWKGLLNIEVDYFREKRSNMLVTPDVVVPAEYGIGLSQVNAGVMENKGVDFSVSSAYRISRDFQVSLAGNFTYAQNTLLQVFETSTTFNNPNRRKTGKPLGTQFGLNALGFFQQDDFDNDGNLKEGIAVQPWGMVHPGDLRYQDINGDGKIDDNDLTKIGNPGTPTIIYGISPGVRFRGFSLDLLFQGAAKTNFYFSNEGAWPFHSGRGAFVEHLDYWTSDNPHARNPRITSAPTTNNTQMSSFWMQDASYLRLKSATLAYTIPSQVIQKIHMQNARVYVSGQNILTWTNLENYDPEIAYFRGETYPQQKVVSVGLNVTF